MVVYMKNSFGQMRSVKVGFSWTALFFGAFVFLFRGLPGKFILWLILCVCSVGILSIVLAFIANKMTAKAYLERGFGPTAPNDPAWLFAMSKWHFPTSLVSASTAAASA